MQYRSLTFEEIETLESNSCWAEDWNRVKVAEDGFQAKFFHRVMFYGDIQLGSVQKEVEITKGFVKHSGINDATLRNVTVGNNCRNRERLATILITIYWGRLSSSLISLSWRLRREQHTVKVTLYRCSTRLETVMSSSSMTLIASSQPLW